LLRQIFGPSKEEVWKQLCNEIGAEFGRYAHLTGIEAW
jgi:hypothetical protein